MLNIRSPLHFGATLSIRQQIDYSEDTANHFMPDFKVAWQPGAPDYQTAPNLYMAELVNARKKGQETLAGIDDHKDPISIVIEALPDRLSAIVRTERSGESFLERLPQENAGAFMARILACAADKAKTLLFPPERGKVLVNQAKQSLAIALGSVFPRLPSLDEKAGIHPPMIPDGLQHTRQYDKGTTITELDFCYQKLKLTSQSSERHNYISHYGHATYDSRTKYTLTLGNNPDGPVIEFTTVVSSGCLHPSECIVESLQISQPSPMKGGGVEAVNLISSDRGKTFQPSASEALGGQGLFDDPCLTDTMIVMKNQCQQLIRALKAIGYVQGMKQITF